jgi:hypothetical protein
VQRDNPAVRKYVEFFLLLLIAIDLVAIVLKLTHLLSTGGAYEKHAAALRSMDVVDAHRLQEHADVLARRISLEAQAQRAADERTFLGEAAQPEVEPEPSERPSRGSWPARTATVQPVTE